MLARIFLAALLLFGQFAPSLAGSPALRQQMMQPPGWVNHNYYPTSDFNEALQRYWTQSGYTGPTQQLTVSRASIGTYSDSFGNWYQAANNVARIGYGTGVWVEEARTNSIRNNTGTGLVAGSPGTAPTNWFLTGSGTDNLTRTLSSGTLSGIAYVGVEYAGTQNASAILQIEAESGTNAIPASYGQTWTVSGFVSLGAGTLANISSVLIGFDEYNASSFLNAHTSTISITGTLTRFILTATLTNAAANSVRGPYIQLNVAGSGVTDATIFYGWPQLELNSLINSSVASATVNAGGTLYTPSSSGTVTWSGSGCTTNPVLNVTTSVGGAINAVTSVATAGSCTTFPSSSATTWTDGTGLGTGSGASFNLVPVNNAALGFATSPIPTTNAAVTRAADVITYTSPGTFCPRGYSMVAWGTPFAPVTYATLQVAAQLDDNTQNNRLAVRRSTGIFNAVEVSAGSSQTISQPTGTWAQNAIGKMAISASNGSLNIATSASTTGSGTGVLPIGATIFRVGSAAQGGSFFNGPIAHTTLWNCTVLPAAALQSATNPSLNN